MDDLRQFAPATQRNREPILAVLERVLPKEGTVLEIASGTGEHSIFLAPRLSPRRWLPSDQNRQALASIEAWQAHTSATNLHSPINLDVTTSTWPVETDREFISRLSLTEFPITAIVNINMIHISPWSACAGLMAGAGRVLPTDGILYLYGPFMINGQHTAPSNAAFDNSLRSQNFQWGVRDLKDVIALANTHHLKWVETVEMPANNLSVIFCKI